MTATETYHAEVACCTSTLLREVAEPTLKRRDIATTYMLAMRSSDAEQRGDRLDDRQRGDRGAVVAGGAYMDQEGGARPSEGAMTRKASRMAQRAAGSLFGEQETIPCQ